MRVPPIINHACHIDTEDASRYRSCGAWLDVTLYDYLACGGIIDAHFGERLCIYVVLRENTTTSLSGVCSFPEARGLAKTK